MLIDSIQKKLKKKKNEVVRYFPSTRKKKEEEDRKIAKRRKISILSIQLAQQMKNQINKQRIKRKIKKKINKNEKDTNLLYCKRETYVNHVLLGSCIERGDSNRPCPLPDRNWQRSQCRQR